MQSTFTQGILHGQLDPVNPSYLAKNGQYIDVVVQPEPIIAIVADGLTRSYLITEAVQVTHAWGPFTTSDDFYLYWDLNKATGKLTRGFTKLAPVVGSQPASPAVDQHWFDPTLGYMQYWNGTAWVRVIRVFAGKLLAGVTLTFYAFGSQVGLNGTYTAGYIMMGATGVGIKDSSGLFVTTDDSLTVQLGALAHPLGLETTVQYAVATESLAAFALVTPNGVFNIKNANASTGDTAIGMVLHATSTGESARIYTAGLIYNPNWNFSSLDFGKTLYLADTGTLTTTRTGNPQIVGAVMWTNHIMLDLNAFSGPALSAIAALSSNISQVSALTSVNASAIHSNSAQMTSADNDIRSAVAALSAVVSVNASAMNTISAAVQALSVIVSNNVSAKEALSAIVSNTISAMRANSAQMTSADNAISNAVSVLNAVVNNNISAIAANSATFTSAIAANSAQMTSATAATNNTVSVITSQVLDLRTGTATTLATDTNLTYTGAQMVGGVIVRTSLTAPRSDTTANAAQLVAALTTPVIGSMFTLRVVNTSASAITILNGTNVTLVGNMTVGANASHDFIGIATNVTGGTEAISFYG